MLVLFCESKHLIFQLWNSKKHISALYLKRLHSLSVTFKSDSSIQCKEMDACSFISRKEKKTTQIYVAK